MGRHTKYEKLLTPLLARPSFTTQEAEQAGVPRHVLSYLYKKGILERLARGLYRSIDYESDVDIELEDLATTAASIPEGVICLISALSYYEMTEEIPREYWITIPHNMWPPKRLHLRAIRMRNIELGQQKITIGGLKLKIFDRERCVVDAFRFLSRETAIKALRAYLFDPDHKANFRKLSRYARALRQNLTPYILTLTT